MQKVKYAVRFDGKDDYFLISNNDSINLKDATIITHVLFNRDASPIIFKNYAYQLNIDLDYKIWFGIWGAALKTNVSKNKYIMISVTFKYSGIKRGVCRIFKNDALDIEANLNEQIDYSNEDLYIGMKTDAIPKWYYYGIIMFILLYNRALSESEIKHIYYNYPDIPTKGLVLWLDARNYDEANGKWYDLSKYGNHATAYGNPKKVRLVEEEVVIK